MNNGGWFFFEVLTAVFMEDKKIIKFWLALGLMVAIFIVAASVRVHAYEQTELDYEVFYQNIDYPSTSDTRWLYYTSYSPYTSDMINLSDTDIIGYNISTPVPYYADGDHVSIFISFGVSIPRVDFQGSNNTWGGQYRLLISPSGATEELSYPQGMQSSTLFDLKYYVQNAVWTDLTHGTMTWQNQTVSYKCLLFHGSDGATYGTGFQDLEHFFFNIQLDLNLTSNRELLPFSIALWQQSLAVGGNQFFRFDTRPIVRLNDTSMYGLLQDIESALSDLDFSGLADLSGLSAQIENIYNSVVLNNDLLESIYDDGGTDEDLTAWAERASEFESQNEYMHSLENDLMGTIEEFTFPSAPDGSNNALITGGVLPWFSNEIVLALTLASLALMVVFAIL